MKYSKAFPKEDLIDLADDIVVDGLKIIEKEIEDTTRWSVVYSLIFQDLETEKFYKTHFSVGATEYQDEQPFEHEPDMIECREVVAEQVTITKYVNRK